MIGEKTHKRGRNVRKSSWFSRLLSQHNKLDCSTCAFKKTLNGECDDCRIREDLTFTKWTAKK